MADEESKQPLNVLQKGEYVYSAEDLRKMGGQEAVYRFRESLRGQG